MTEDHKAVNVIVIAIWVLIGLAIIFSLFDASKIKNVELYVQLIAALATVGSVYIAYRAVMLSAQATEDLRKDRELELENKKPEFQLNLNSLERTEIGFDGEDSCYKFLAHAIQIGAHPASLTVATSYLIHWELKKRPDVIIAENANDIHHLSSIEIKEESLVGEGDVPDDFTYHIMEISYRDKITGRKYVQKLFKRLMHCNRSYCKYPEPLLSFYNGSSNTIHSTLC